MIQPPGTIWDFSLADELSPDAVLSKENVQELFNYFKNSSLFRWNDANNDCEDRANAIGILLDAWGIANYKAWVFSEFFRKKGLGELLNRWNYHVAPVFPVQEKDAISYLVMDPATSQELIAIENWALQITASGNSYHFIKHGNYYIFPSCKIQKDNWHKRNKRNLNWTMQGLSGINGMSAKGRAQLAFNKRMVKRTEISFRKLKNQKPGFANG